MSLQEALALYAPLVGLMGLCFWTGSLTQRVKSLEKTVFDERRAATSADDHDRLVKIEAAVGAVSHDTEAIKRQMNGVQAQLRNLMLGKGGLHQIIDETGVVHE